MTTSSKEDLKAIYLYSAWHYWTQLLFLYFFYIFSYFHILIFSYFFTFFIFLFYIYIFIYINMHCLLCFSMGVIKATWTTISEPLFFHAKETLLLHERKDFLMIHSLLFCVYIKCILVYMITCNVYIDTVQQYSCIN